LDVHKSTLLSPIAQCLLCPDSDRTEDILGSPLSADSVAKVGGAHGLFAWGPLLVLMPI
jgi:hypothetical protein